MLNLLTDGAVAPTIADALANATTILSSAWDFITGNAIIFGACALGLLAMAIFKVKALF